MSEFFASLDFETIQSQSDLKSVAEVASITLNQIAATDQKAHKQVVIALLSKIHSQITSPASSPKSKLMSLLLLKEFARKHATAQRKEEKHSKLFSLLSNHELLQELRNIGEKVDPYKQPHEKGKALFPNHAAIGNDFIRLVLQLLRYWASKFPTTSKKDPTAFKRFYDELLDKKVLFPTDYKFLAFANPNPTHRAQEAAYETNRSKQGQQAGSKDQAGSSSFVTPGGPGSAPTRAGVLKSEIHHTYSRLVNFVERLREQGPSVDQQIRTAHTQVVSDLNKYQKMQEQVLTLDEDIINKYFAIMEFMQKENQFYQQLVTHNNDYKSYSLAISLQGEKSFPELNQTDQPNPPKAQKLSSKIPVGSNVRVVGGEKQKPVAVNDSKAIAQVSNYFSKLQQRSKSPLSGFKQIRDSVSREKATGLKRSVSPINRSNHFTKSATSLKESKISPIFTHPPNSKPQPKTYEGRLVSENDVLGNVLRLITKSQGLRRFKTANFKAKSTLFENQHIQIGYKSEAIHEEVGGFNTMIKIDLFLGNLTDQRIDNISLQFKGDPSILLYANPRTIDPALYRGDQSKIDLIIVPLKAPFPLIKMALKYQFNGIESVQPIVLPNSVLKLAHYMSLSRKEFAQKWPSPESILKTSEVRLCHYLPPDSFKRWIEGVGELTEYTAFAATGSNKDYQLFCRVILMQRHEALLKINVRPNLNVVIQLGLEDSSEQAMQYFTFFLETLQQVLKEQS